MGPHENANLIIFLLYEKENEEFDNSFLNDKHYAHYPGDLVTNTIIYVLKQNHQYLYFMVCVHFSHKKYINQKENAFQKKLKMIYSVFSAFTTSLKWRGLSCIGSKRTHGLAKQTLVRCC